MERAVPSPPASGCGERQGGTPIQHPPPCSMQGYHAVVRQKFGNLTHERSVTIQSATTARVRPCLTSRLPRCQQLSSINLPLAQPWPQAERWGADFHDTEESAVPVEQVLAPLVPGALTGGARQHPLRGSSPSIIPGSHRRVADWPGWDVEEGTEGTGLSIPMSMGSALHPGQHHASGDGIPLTGVPVMNPLEIRSCATPTRDIGDE